MINLYVFYKNPELFPTKMDVQSNVHTDCTNAS